MTTLVLIHAFPLSSQMWRGQVKALEKQVRIVTPDLPGFGHAQRQSRPSIPEMAKGIAAHLDSLKIKEPVIVGGLSMGGYVAFEFFRQFPERVRALGLFATRAAADTPEAREKRKKAIELIRTQGLEPFSKTVLPNLLGKTTRESKPDMVSEVTRMILSNAPEGVADALAAMASRRDSTDLLGSIYCPTLIVAGEEDTFIPAAEAESMHQKISGSQFHILPKAGHLVNLEQPEVFEEILKKFLA